MLAGAVLLASMQASLLWPAIMLFGVGWGGLYTLLQLLTMNSFGLKDSGKILGTITVLDALGGGPGRAIDLALKLGYDFSRRWALTFGYRTVEGGADVDDVYNFAWFNYAVVSGVYKF